MIVTLLEKNFVEKMLKEKSFGFGRKLNVIFKLFHVEKVF